MARDIPNANDNHVVIPDIPAQSGAGTWSISVWFEHDAQAGSAQWVYYATNGAGDYMQFFWDGTSVYRTRWDVNGTGELVDATIAEVPLNVWHNYICTYDGSNVRVYIDGTEIAGSPNAAAGGLDNVATFTLGNTANNLNPWDGDIAEFAQWSRALKVGEITAIAKGVPASKFYPNQVYVPLWGGTERDYGPFHYAVTVTGTTTTAHPPIAPHWGYDAALPFVVAAAPATGNPWYAYAQM